MKIRLDFVTNSSSSSFVAVSIVDSELAKLCKEYNIKLGVSGDKVYCNYDLGESELPIAPHGTDFVRWFIGFISAINAGDYTARKAIEDHRKEIEDAFVESNIVYEHYCTEDYYYNSHWEETRDKEKTVLKGFDTGTWDEVWRTQDWDDIAALYDGRDVSGLAPAEYPYWLFLSEGWANAEPGSNFVRKMMDKYGTKVFEIRSENDDKPDPKDEEIKKLLYKVKNMAVDPEAEDLSMKSIAAETYHIDGRGIYSPDSDRYSHIDKSYLDKVKLGWVDSDYTDEYKKILLIEEKNKVWAEHIKKMYTEAIDDLGAIQIGNISSRSDYAIVIDSADGAVDKYEIENYVVEKYNLSRYGSELRHVLETEGESAKKSCYISYLRRTLSFIDDANSNRGDKPPVKVLLESQFYDYLMKHTSLGNVEPKPVFGPNGTRRLKVPEKYKRTLDYALTEMVARWPSRIINPKTRTYERISKDIEGCYKDIGYSGIEEFLDAYGFSIKQEVSKSNTNTAGDFEFEKSKKNEVTVVKYIGSDKKVIIPDSIDGGTVKTIGKDAFAGNQIVEEVILPESVETLRGKAFCFSKSIKTIHLSNNISRIVRDTFEGCSNLSEINIPDKVTVIDPGTFKDCPLKALHIGKSLETLDRGAFYQGEYSVEQSESFAFEGYQSSYSDYEWHYRASRVSELNKITIDEQNGNLIVSGSMILTAGGKVLLAMLGDDSHCTIPEGVEIIADNAFKTQGFLEEVSFPESLRIIGNNAFERCKFESVVIPKSVEVIGAKAFYYCSYLKHAFFNEGLKEIYNDAFSSTKIKEVVLPDSLRKLGYDAFSFMANVEPDRWTKEVKRWERIAMGGGARPDYKTLETAQMIEGLIKSEKQSVAESSINNNKIGYGLLATMMAFLQSENANDIAVDKRLQLEQVVISREMESVLGTDLKLILSFYKDKATEQLNKCINYIRTEADPVSLEEFYTKVKHSLRDDEIVALVDSAINTIRKEA